MPKMRMPSVKVNLKRFNVEVWDKYLKRWTFWVDVYAVDKIAAEYMILDSNPPKRFRVR